VSSMRTALQATRIKRSRALVSMLSSKFRKSGKWRGWGGGGDFGFHPARRTSTCQPAQHVEHFAQLAKPLRRCGAFRSSRSSIYGVVIRRPCGC
jgi:hypothetical protein